MKNIHSKFKMIKLVVKAVLKRIRVRFSLKQILLSIFILCFSFVPHWSFVIFFFCCCKCKTLSWKKLLSFVKTKCYLMETLVVVQSKSEEVIQKWLFCSHVIRKDKNISTQKDKLVFSQWKSQNLQQFLQSFKHYF